MLLLDLIVSSLLTSFTNSVAGFDPGQPGLIDHLSALTISKQIRLFPQMITILTGSPCLAPAWSISLPSSFLLAAWLHETVVCRPSFPQDGSAWDRVISCPVITPYRL